MPKPLQDEIKGLRVTTAKMDVETARCKELQEALAALQHQLDVMTDSHSETLKQLELAKFFLQASIATGTNCTAPIHNVAQGKHQHVPVGLLLSW